MLQLDAKTLEMIQKNCKGKKHIKLTVGLLSDDERLVKTFGEMGEIENENFTYEIGSVTKTFTASLLAKHIHEGKMSLEDSIQKYVKGLGEDRYYPTLRRLVTHTAGYSFTLPLTKGEYFKMALKMIKSNEDSGAFPFSMDFEKMKRLLEGNVLKDKDYGWKYSNFSLALVGYAIGVASGMGYHVAMSDFLTTELGLAHTYLGNDPNKNIHGYTGKNIDCGNWIWGEDLTAPAGDISSTAEDLLTYAEININADRDRPYMTACHQKYADIKIPFLKKYSIGLGWMLHKDNSSVIWHTGGTGAFSSYLGVDKDNRRAAVVLANYRIEPTKIGEAILLG